MLESLEALSGILFILITSGTLISCFGLYIVRRFFKTAFRCSVGGIFILTVTVFLVMILFSIFPCDVGIWSFFFGLTACLPLAKALFSGSLNSLMPVWGGFALLQFCSAWLVSKVFIGGFQYLGRIF